MRIVIKIGTSSLIDKSGILNKNYIANFVTQIKELIKRGHQVILVSSGAIGTAIGKMGNGFKAQTLSQKQAMSAIGQPIIMSVYNEYFAKNDLICAQVLLTREDFENREKYLNVRNTLTQLLDWNVVAVINENDTVAVEEINFGDNDTLAALVSVLADADLLIIFTDVAGLYAGSPNKSALIKKVEKITGEIENYAKPHSSSGKGRGGMSTKIIAAKIATASGIDVMIVSSAKYESMADFIISKDEGTYFEANKKTIEAKKSWIAFGKKVRGTIFVDEKAAEMIIHKNKSLLAVGIVKVSGNFKKGDTVFIAYAQGKAARRDFARGLVNFDAHILNQIKGKKTAEIKALFAQSDDEIIHKDNLIVF
ncbi:MAG: glutamate 5-kinase [Elusimicrobiota bacterium]|jgi:glutamate 5-kinase|nr:glutamate 5-kinase [Elusimicrobiota bacterium]